MPQIHGPEEPPSEGLGTRERILEFAISALEAGPESGLVILDLSKNSGISMGSIYHFFSNREGLIVAGAHAHMGRHSQLHGGRDHGTGGEAVLQRQLARLELADQLVQLGDQLLERGLLGRLFGHRRLLALAFRFLRLPVAL